MDYDRERIRLNKQLEDGSIWTVDKKKAEDITRRLKWVDNLLRDFHLIENDIETIASFLNEDDQEILTEVSKTLEKTDRLMTSFEIRLLLSEKYDRNNAILSIHPGAGGVESCDWAGMLKRMYERFFERKALTYTIIDFEPDDVAGVKSVTFEIKGDFPYGLLKGERGIHRLVRVSPFDATNRRHTSFAAVDVLPVLDDVEIHIDDDDLRVDTFRASGHGGQNVNKVSSAVRITHKPTGLVAQCQNERSQYQNKQNALKILRAKLFELELKKKDKELNMERGEKKDIAWGNQIRSYVLFPYQMIKDHRTDFQRHDVDNVLDGDLDDFIYHYLIKFSHG